MSHNKKKSKEPEQTQGEIITYKQFKVPIYSSVELLPKQVVGKSRVSIVPPASFIPTLLSEDTPTLTLCFHYYSFQLMVGGSKALERTFTHQIEIHSTETSTTQRMEVMGYLYSCTSFQLSFFPTHLRRIEGFREDVHTSNWDLLDGFVNNSVGGHEPTSALLKSKGSSSPPRCFRAELSNKIRRNHLRKQPE